MASLSLPIVSFFLVLASFAFYSSPSAAQICGITSVYQLGDSLADAGNVINFPGAATVFGAGRPPYGETFFKKPTGRFSDGRIINDFIVSAFDLPFLNAYLDKTAVNNFSQGVNFAFAGATAMSNGFWAPQNVRLPAWNQHMNIQLGWFKSYLQLVCGSNCAQTLKDSLVIFGEFGGVDHYNVLLQNIRRPRRFVVTVIDEIVKGIREVVQLGATRILVPGVFPFGCLPVYLARFQSPDPNAYDPYGCLAYLNDYASLHNTELNIAITHLQSEFPNIRIVYGDYYGAFLTVLRNSARFGFNQNTLLSACCGGGGGRYNSAIACGAAGSRACPNPSQHISWDGIHLTEEAHKHMAEYLFNDMYIKFGCNHNVADSGLLSSY